MLLSFQLRGSQCSFSGEEAKEVAEKMIGHNLITKQTGDAGRPCNKVRVSLNPHAVELC